MTGNSCSAADFGAGPFGKPTAMFDWLVQMRKLAHTPSSGTSIVFGGSFGADDDRRALLGSG